LALAVRIYSVISAKGERRRQRLERRQRSRRKAIFFVLHKPYRDLSRHHVATHRQDARKAAAAPRKATAIANAAIAEEAAATRVLEQRETNARDAVLELSAADSAGSAGGASAANDARGGESEAPALVASPSAEDATEESPAAVPELVSGVVADVVDRVVDGAEEQLERQNAATSSPCQPSAGDDDIDGFDDSDPTELPPSPGATDVNPAVSLTADDVVTEVMSEGLERAVASVVSAASALANIVVMQCVGTAVDKAVSTLASKPNDQAIASSSASSVEATPTISATKSSAGVSTSASASFSRAPAAPDVPDQRKKGDKKPRTRRGNAKKRAEKEAKANYNPFGNAEFSSAGQGSGARRTSAPDDSTSTEQPQQPQQQQPQQRGKKRDGTRWSDEAMTNGTKGHKTDRKKQVFAQSGLVICCIDGHTVYITLNLCMLCANAVAAGIFVRYRFPAFSFMGV